MSILVIAEAGVNHNGDIEIAKTLIDVAADAKADIVKFQTFNADQNNRPQKENTRQNNCHITQRHKVNANRRRNQMQTF